MVRLDYLSFGKILFGHLPPLLPTEAATTAIITVLHIRHQLYTMSSQFSLCLNCETAKSTNNKNKIKCL